MDVYILSLGVPRLCLCVLAGACKLHFYWSEEEKVWVIGAVHLLTLTGSKQNTCALKMECYALGLHVLLPFQDKNILVTAQSYSLGRILIIWAVVCGNRFTFLVTSGKFSTLNIN